MGIFDIFKRDKQTSPVVENYLPSKINELSEQINFPDIPNWQISISFRKSSSNNFDIALFLAKKSSNYTETQSHGNTIYQAFFEPDSYSDFETLYKLIKDWKSTFILLNGELIDKKSMSKLNRCLGDKIRLKDPTFCFGASEFTSNPFGCHRLMLTPSQHPWWEYGNFNTRKEWIIDKQQIKEQIFNKAVFYEKCPYFNLERALSVVDKLPNKLTNRKDQKMFTFTDNGVYPEAFNYSKIDKYYINN